MGYTVFNHKDSMSLYHKAIRERQSREPLNIGFPKLREALTAVLTRGGLIMLGGAPSSGKTTFAMQMLCSIAEHDKRDIMIISLEMGYDELMSRDISRIMYSKVNKQTAKSATDLLNGYSIDNGIKTLFTEAERNAEAKAEDYYIERIAEHLFTYEVSGIVTPDTITGIINEHISTHAGEPPIILLDYMQIVQGDGTTDEQRAASNLAMSLKGISRQHKAPIFTISSTARMNYDKPSTMSFAKNSGAFEYSADVAMFLEPEELYTIPNVTQKDLEEAKRNTPREMVIALHKNRGGAAEKKYNYQYYSAYNYFIETGERE